MLVVCGGASARSEKCAWSTLEELQKYNTEYDAFDSYHYCTLKSKHLGFNPLMCDECSHFPQGALE
jgi:hypothetical protein